jgi:hypothetical protein
MRFDWVSILRDALIVLLLGTVGIYVASVLGGATIPAVTIGAMAGLSSGFCLVGCRAKVDRVRHLGTVALVAWLVGSGINLAMGRTSIAWVFSWGLLVCALALLLGGGLSFAIARPQAGSGSPRP